MEVLFAVLSLFVWIIILCILLYNYSFSENLFSPMNTFIYFQLLVVIALFAGLFGIVNWQEIFPGYFLILKYSKPDYGIFTLNIILYTLFDVGVLFFLKAIGYNGKNYRFKICHVKDWILAIWGIVLLFILLVSVLLSGFRGLTYRDVMKLRYFLTHGYAALIYKVNFPILNALLVYSILYKKKLYIIFYTVLLIVWALIIGSRGIFIFSILFILFLTTNVSFIDLLSFKHLKQFVVLGLVLLLILLYYYAYSVYIRGYEGTLYGILMRRLDYFSASYFYLEKRVKSWHFKQLLYPLLAYIPRNILPNKPFPTSSAMTYDIFGYYERWSVSCGVVGESLYIFPILWELFSAFFVAFFLKIFKSISRRNLSVYDIAILYIMYNIPSGILFVGILNPSIGDVIYLVPLLRILSIFSKGEETC